MKIVILCGGLGTRLREETEFRPKPMVNIGGYPILWHIMKIYAAHGFRDFVLCLGYRGDIIKEYFLNYEAMNNDFTIRLGSKHEITYHNAHLEQDFRVTLVDTGAETMTGGRIKRIQRYIEDETFMVTYGDGVGDINLRALADFHQQHGGLATLTSVCPLSRFGELKIDNTNTVTAFLEKAQVDYWISAGFFVFNRGIFDLLEDDDTVLEKMPLQTLSQRGQLHAYRHHGAFYTMDTYREYLALNELWKSGQAPWKIWHG